MIKLKYNNKLYKMIESYNYEKSSREVKYSNITIDFTDLTSSDLPKKYQECQVIDENSDKVLYTGYASNFNVSDMKLENDVFRSLEIELISPMALATVRMITLKGSYSLKNALQKIIAPLISDGFTLKELNVNNKKVTINFILNSIEDVLNKLSNSNNFWWYIDENKNIYINDITYQFSKDSVMVYDNKPPKGLYKIEPTIDIEDYCNVVNIKNVRVYSASIVHDGKKLNPILETTTIKKGDTITFAQPIDINYENAVASFNELQSSLEAYDINDNPPIIMMEGDTSTHEYVGFYVLIDNGNIIVSDNLKIDENNEDEEQKEFELVKDSFFSNLVTGFKYNGEEEITITSFMSISCLKWTNVKFYDNVEIEKQKNIISVSGQIEKTIDLNEQWKLMSEVTTLARSTLDANSGNASIVKLYFDVKKDIDVGDIVEINKPNFLIEESKYICTDISYTYNNTESEEYVYELRNKNYLTSFIDMFRAESEETSTDKIETFVISNYIEEKMEEVHEVVK